MSEPAFQVGAFQAGAFQVGPVTPSDVPVRVTGSDAEAGDVDVTEAPVTTLTPAVSLVTDLAGTDSYPTR